MKAPLWWAWLLASGCLCACERTIVLGSECADFDAPCLVLRDRDAALALDATQAREASSQAPASDADSPAPIRDADVGQADAEEVEGAGVAEIEAELPVANPSFERGGGLAGDVVLNNLIGTLLPIPARALADASRRLALDDDLRALYGHR